MILISHRGNTNGRFESYENEPTYIDMAIKKGFDVEVDMWHKDKTLWLGHDKPQYGIDVRWFIDRLPKLWVHCKNIEVLEFFQRWGGPVHYFWHENDKVTLTSQNYIWAYPTNEPINSSIAVMPELFGSDVSKCLGICSDIVEQYKV